MNEELLKQAKENLAELNSMSKELYDFFMRIGKENCIFLLKNGRWTKAGIDDSFATNLIYRVEPNYQPPIEKPKEIEGIEVGDIVATIHKETNACDVGVVEAVNIDSVKIHFSQCFCDIYLNGFNIVLIAKGKK